MKYHLALAVGLGCLLLYGVADEVCYGDLGCFSNDPPYDNVRYLPESPAEVDTQFWLYTRLNPDVSQTLNRTDPSSIIESHFKAGSRTIFQLYGWGGLGKPGIAGWVDEMRQEFLKHDDMNVILVYWDSTGRYPQCVANGRIVGAEIDALLDALTLYTGFDVNDAYLVGHSLGAHVAGHAGQRNPMIGRITGIDPAGPAYENHDPAVRLDATDAQFVDIIHTDGERIIPQAGFGTWIESGHVDFYPNGGKDQPGCKVMCDHKIGRDYYIESINQCPFTAYPCQLEQWDGCDACGSSGCSYMGYHADTSDARGVFYLETNPDPPYCQG
ncbi:pancreatic lipase-related protein 2-like [Saccoglossus kowalevskii]